MRLSLAVIYLPYLPTLPRISRILASFVSAWLSLRLLQSKHSESYADVERVVEGADGPAVVKVTRYAGRTLDLTLFAACRAIDVVVGELWDRRRMRRVAAGTWTRVCAPPIMRAAWQLATKSAY